MVREWKTKEALPMQKRHDSLYIFSAGLGGEKLSLPGKLKLGHDIAYYYRDDARLATTENGIQTAVLGLKMMINKAIEKHQYEEVLLIGKSFGGLISLLAAENKNSVSKILCVPAFVEPFNIIKDNEFLLPDGETIIPIHQSNIDFLRNKPVEDAVAKITAEILFILGDEDKSQSPEILHQLADQHENVRVEMIKTAGHRNLLDFHMAQHKAIEFIKKQ